jgi:hypothetical protein
LKSTDQNACGGVQLRRRPKRQQGRAVRTADAAKNPIVNTPNFTAAATGRSYRDFEGDVLRCQFQVNY